MMHALMLFSALPTISQTAPAMPGLPTARDVATAYTATEYVSKCPLETSDCDWATIATPAGEVKSLSCRRIGNVVARCGFSIRGQRCQARFVARSEAGLVRWVVARNSARGPERIILRCKA
jgi:hypothetical protein